MVKSGLQSMTVRGVTKRSYWKYEADSDEWVECPNLPVSYEDVYLERGFRKSPPEKKEVAPELFAESGASAPDESRVTAEVSKKA